MVCLHEAIGRATDRSDDRLVKTLCKTAIAMTAFIESDNDAARIIRFRSRPNSDASNCCMVT